MSQILRLADPLVPVLCQTAHNHYTRVCKRQFSEIFTSCIYVLLFLFILLSPLASAVTFKHLSVTPCVFANIFANITERFVNKFYKYFNDNINFRENVGRSDFLIFTSIRFFKFSWIILPFRKVSLANTNVKCLSLHTVPSAAASKSPRRRI